MSTTIDALVEALELIEPHLDKLVDYSATAVEYPLNLAPEKVRAALSRARAEQAEPVAWMSEHTNGRVYFAATPAEIYPDTAIRINPLYTSPQPAKLEPLTEAEISELWYKGTTGWIDFARAIEATHNAKLRAK